MNDLHFFDRSREFDIIERRLPHWTQAGVMCFVTFRTNDSMPAGVLNQWRAERQDWLRRQGINPMAGDWRDQLQRLDKLLQEEFFRSFSEKWHNHLDAGHGDCVLRRGALSRIVADSLLHANGEKYLLTDFVIMPNHVHLLAAFPGERALLDQCRSWKHFTATEINREVGRRGRFWQQDGFDHLVRSESQYRHFQRYIAHNPVKAGLSPGEFVHWQDESHRPKYPSRSA
ncbi:MAG: transposase, partial [Planctomycetaceae bacterium]|nr:transposase [Planctomycetaceae bacterium]